MSDTLAIIVSVTFISGLIWLYFWSRARRRAIEAAYPTTWVNIGPPVSEDDLGIALDVIRDELLAAGKEIPGGRWGGTIVWTDELPFMVGTIAAAGTVLNFKEPRIKLSRIEPIEYSALAHELGHAYWDPNDRNIGETTYYDESGRLRISLNPDFQAWVDATNRKIAAACGR